MSEQTSVSMGREVEPSSERPSFKPSPAVAALVKDLPERDKWMFGQADVQRQQNEWIINRMCEGDHRFGKLEKRAAQVEQTVAGMQVTVGEHEALRQRMTRRSTVVLGFLGTLTVSVIGAVIHWALTKK